MKRLAKIVAMTVALTASATFSVLPTYAETANTKDTTISQSINVKVEDGIHVNVSFKSDQKSPEFIPSFTIQLLSESGDKVLGTARADSSNFDKTTSSYNLVFNVKDYKTGDKFKLALAKADSVVTGIDYKGFGQRDDGSYTYTDYKITSKDSALINIFEKKYTTNNKELDDAAAVINTVLYGSKDYQVMMDLKTDSTKTLLILQDEEGKAMTNLPLKVKGTYTKVEIDVTSDSNGMVIIDKSKVFPIFTATPNKNGYKIVGSESGIYQGTFPVLAVGQELQGVTSFKMNVKNEGLGSINNPGVTANITTDANTALSSNWTEVELSLTNKDDVKQTATVSMKNNKIALADGTYKVEIGKSDYADVNLKTSAITVKDGKAEINMSLKPKYTLEVAKENNNYKFSVINVEAIKDKVYSGKNPTVFAVAPGETYMIKDNDTSKVMTVAIQANAKVTKLSLDGGVVYGQTSSNPHTGDSMLYLLILMGITGLGAGFIFVKYRNHQKLLATHLVNNNKNSMLSLFLVGAVTASMIATGNPVKVHAGGGGKYASGSNGTGKAISGNLVWDDNIPGKQIPGVLQIGFEPTASANLTEDATIADLASTSKFAWSDLMLYLTPTQRASDIWLNSGYLAKRGDDLYTIFGTSPLTPGVAPVYTSDRASRTIAVDTNSSNTFTKDISTAVKDKTLHSDSEPVGNALDSMIKGKYYNAEQKVRDQFFNDYIDLLSKTGVSQSNIDNLKQLYSEDKVSLFTQSLIGYRVKGADTTDYSKYCYVSVRDTLEVISITESVSINPEESEWSIYSKLHATYANGPLDIKYGGLSGAGYRATNKYMQQLYPLSKNITTGPPANVYGGFGFWHWTNDKTTQLAPNPMISVDLDVTVVDDKGNSTGENFTMSVEGWQEKDKREFIKMVTSSVDGVEESTVSGSMVINYNKKTYNILAEDKVPVDFYDVLDKEPLNKTPLSKTGAVKDIKIKVPFYNDNTQWKFIIGGNTEPTAQSLHEYLGGSAEDNEQSIDWFDLDYYEWYMSSFGETPSGATVQENKYEDQKTADGKPMSSNAKAIIYVKVIDGTPQNLDAEAYEVPEWRLSEFWPEISNKVQNTATFSMKLTPDDPGAPSTLKPSGLATFNLVNPDLTGADWAKSKSHFIGSTGTANVTHNYPQAQFKVGGDLLATRLSKDSNIKFANWLSNIPLLTGVDSTPIGSSLKIPSIMDKNFTFKYPINNALNYIHNIGKEETKQVQTGTDATGNPIYEDQTYYYTTKETPTKSYTSADYNKTVRFNRYTPKPNSVITIKTTSGADNGYYYETKQDSSILKVDPEILMAYEDTNGNTSVGYVAGDRLREIKPTSYSYLKLDANVKSFVTGTPVTDSNAQRLVQSLNAGTAPVLYKGSAINASFEIGGSVIARTFALDIAGSSKNTWNPGVTYKSDDVSNAFLGKLAIKDESGNWTANITKQGRLKINGIEYGGITAQDNLVGSTKVIQHRLDVKGGKLQSVDGVAIDKVSGDLRNAVEKMGLIGSNNIFGVFESNTGAALSEQNVANLFNAVRGNSDAAINKGWYSEDSSVLVINEYATTFDLNKSLVFADKIPMTVPGIEAPVNKAQFFQSYTDAKGTHAGGYPGYTILDISLPIATFKFDSSSSGIQYIVGNASILDSTN